MIKDIDFNSNKPWIVLTIALVLVVFYLHRCKPVPTPQTITTTKILKDTLRLIEQDRKKIEDSFNLILSKHYDKDNFNNGQFVNLVNQNTELAEINEKLQQELTYPENCREVVNKLNAAHGNYVSQTKQTLDKANKSISGLSQTIETQKSFLSEKDKLYSRLKTTLDTCILNNAALEKYAKQVKPKRSINLNVQTISPYVSIKPEVGIGLGYENRKGLEISFTYYTNQQISVSIRKPLIRF